MNTYASEASAPTAGAKPAAAPYASEASAYRGVRSLPRPYASEASALTAVCEAYRGRPSGISQADALRHRPAG
jgi:hypothetical protein